MGVMTATAIVGAGASVYSTINEAKKKRDAEKALNNLEQPGLNNTTENLQVSTLGSDLQKEEQARLSATQVDALQGSGTRGIVGGLGRVESGSQKVNAGIASDLDKQQKDIDVMKAQDDERIRALQEGRHTANVSALSSQYNSGSQGVQMGIGQTIGALGSAANSYTYRDKQEKVDEKDKKDKVGKV